MLDLIHAYALVGRCLTHSVWFAFCISFKAAVDEYTKAVAAMKLASDKVTRDLAQCALIEASLKAKKWDTTKMQEYCRPEHARLGTRTNDSCIQPHATKLLQRAHF